MQNDHFNISHLATHFCHEAAIEKVAAKSDLTRLKNLIEGVEVIADQLRVISAPMLDIEALNKNHKSIEMKAAEIEGTIGKKRRFISVLGATGLALMAIGYLEVIPAITLAVVAPMVVLPTAVGIALFLISAIPVTVGSLALLGYDFTRKTRQRLALTGTTKNMLMFGDAVKDKASGKQPGVVPVIESIRRSFR